MTEHILSVNSIENKIYILFSVVNSQNEEALY